MSIILFLKMTDNVTNLNIYIDYGIYNLRINKKTQGKRI